MSGLGWRGFNCNSDFFLLVMLIISVQQRKIVTKLCLKMKILAKNVKIII